VARRGVAATVAVAVAVACAGGGAGTAAASTRIPRILAAGDSEMQGIYVDLHRRFVSPRRSATVIYDAHPSTGLTNRLLDWVGHAFGFGRSERPDATLMYLGGNEFGPLTTAHGSARCCGRAWTAAYARRVRKMMIAYRRGGMAKVYWATMPAARSAERSRAYRAITNAVVEAAAGFPKTVRVVDLRAVFTPGGRLRATLRRGGRVVRVRSPDGIHLSRAGDHIATQLFVAAMRRDGLRLPG
jgi:hypothetical protein